MSKATSQTISSQGGRAVLITGFALFWNGMVWGAMLPSTEIPFLVKVLFAVVGLGAIAMAVWLLRQRLAGGVVKLRLSQDPLAHGLPQTLSFEFDRDLTAQRWYAEIRIHEQTKNSSSYGKLWSHEFPAQALGTREVRCTVTLPPDMPATASSQGDTEYRVKLTLYADQLSWSFNLATRRATSAELAFASSATVSANYSAPG